VGAHSEPRNFHKSTKWVLRIDGVDRVRFASVTVPDETVTDVVVRQSAETHPNRVPGEYQPVDVEVVAPSFTDRTVMDMWNKTINVVQGGGEIGEDLYFDGDLVQLDRDNTTEMTKYRLHRCYCGGRKFGTFDASTDEVRQIGFILRPRSIEEMPVT
jgi:hypothetical protein